MKQRGLEGFVVKGKQTGLVDGLCLGIVGVILSFVFVLSCHENRLVMHSERAVSVQYAGAGVGVSTHRSEFLQERVIRLM